MTVTTNIDYATARSIQREAIEAIRVIAKKRGMSINTKSNGRHSNLSLTLAQIELVVTENDEGEYVNAEREQFKRDAKYIGIDPAWHGKRFYDNKGRRFEVYKIFPNRPKNCIGIRDTRNGTSFICPISYVKNNS